MESYNTTLQYLQSIHETLVEPNVEPAQEVVEEQEKPTTQSLGEEPVTEDEELSSEE